MSESERVVAWKRANRERYNAYMRELRKRNPAIQRRENERRRERRREQREARG